MSSSYQTDSDILTHMDTKHCFGSANYQQQDYDCYTCCVSVFSVTLFSP